MKWEVEYTDEFEAWWTTLNEGEQDAVAIAVGQLEELGPSLRFPYSSGVIVSLIMIYTRLVVKLVLVI